MITITNRHIEVDVDETLGGEVTRIARPGGENLLFKGDWVSPVASRDSTTYGSDALDWLSSYKGGWQELFPSGGDPSTVMGTPLPFHGEVSRTPVEVVRSSDVALTLRCPTRLPLVLERTMLLDPDRAVLRVEERAVNESDLAVPFIWGHHPAFAVDDETAVDVPAGKLRVSAASLGELDDLATDAEGTWPMAPARDGGEIDLRATPTEPVERLLYLDDIRAGWAALRHLDSREGIAMAWDAETFRHLWMWQQYGGPGFPFYGRARLTALEPNRAWPADGLANAIERGEALEVGPRGVHATWLTMALFEATDAPVTGVTRDGEVRTGDDG